MDATVTYHFAQLHQLIVRSWKELIHIKCSVWTVFWNCSTLMLRCVLLMWWFQCPVQWTSDLRFIWIVCVQWKVWNVLICVHFEHRLSVLFNVLKNDIKNIWADSSINHLWQLEESSQNAGPQGQIYKKIKSIFIMLQVSQKSSASIAEFSVSEQQEAEYKTQK